MPLKLVCADRGQKLLEEGKCRGLAQLFGVASSIRTLKVGAGMTEKDELSSRFCA